VTTREFQDRIARRARRAGVPLPADVGAGLETYFRLLATWNTKTNLTGLDLDDPSPETLDRLLIEPLVAARHAPAGAKTMIDIGSGGGSPALPFALAYPGISLLMVESKTRKSVFLREAVRALSLPSATVATQRFEELLARPDLHERHDLLTIRAVRVESRVLMSLQAFVRPNGHLLLFRGASAADPSETVHPPLSWKATFPLIEAQRSRLVVLEKRTIGR
jgi:16S rRNA (guanine527-N7)-methyltransferase